MNVTPCLPSTVGGRAVGGFGHSRFSSCLKAWALELLEPDVVEVDGPEFIGVFMRSVNPNKPSATLAICTPSEGQARITELPLTQEMISQMALEAQIREMSVAALLAELIAAISKKGLVSSLLTADRERPHAEEASPPAGRSPAQVSSSQRLIRLPRRHARAHGFRRRTPWRCSH